MWQKQLAFARKASGLVRGLSMLDAFGVGFMNQGLTPSIWFAITFGLGVFLGGNLIIASVISVVLAGIGFPIVWGVLGGSMPRSGGEYIYNSRIIHPIFGIAVELRRRRHRAGVDLRAGAAGHRSGPHHDLPLPRALRAPPTGSSAARWIEFGLASVFNIVGWLFVVFGIKIYAVTQKAVMFFGIGGCAVITLVLLFSSKANFIAKWNADAVAGHSPNVHRVHRQGRRGRRPARCPPPGTGTPPSAAWWP